MPIRRIRAFWHNHILRYHLVRGLLFWAVLEVIGAGVAHASRQQFGGYLQYARSQGIDLRVPSVSILLVDFTVLAIAVPVYCLVALRRHEDRVLLANLGIGRPRLGGLIAGLALLILGPTWGLR